MTVFSDKCYMPEPAVLMKPVATPMGILRNPFDIALKPKPFWAVAEAATMDSEKRKKKTIIFAHHRYNKLNQSERNSLMDKLRDAKTQQFRILIQYPDGLKEWDGVDLPEDYALDLKKFNKKTIAQIAWSKKQIAETNLFLLDCIGVQHLRYDKIPITLGLADFQDNCDDLVDLISMSEQNMIYLDMDACTGQLIKKFLTAVAEKKSSFSFHKMKTVNLNDSQITPAELQTIFTDFDGLEEINLGSCRDLSSVFLQLTPWQLRSLKRITLDDSDITPAAFAQLLKAAPNLEKISLQNCITPINTLLEIFKEQHLGHLKEIGLSGEKNQVSSGAFNSLLKGAPSLTSIGLAYTKFPDDLAQLKADTPTQLEYIYSRGAALSPQGLFKLYSISPRVSELDDRVIPGFVSNAASRALHFPNVERMTIEKKLQGESVSAYLDCFTDINFLSLSKPTTSPLAVLKNTFSKLRILAIEMSEDSTQNIERLLNAAPNLHYLDVKGSSANAFLHLQPDCLKSLKTLAITATALEVQENTSLQKNDYLTILKGARHLSSLLCPMTSAFVEAALELKRDQLTCLTELTINSHEEMTIKVIEKLILAAPNLKRLSITENMRAEIEKLEIVRQRKIEINYLEDYFKSLINSDAYKKRMKAREDKGVTDNKEKMAVPENKESIVDKSYFDTKHDPDGAISYKEYFPGVDPTRYRISLWQPDLDTLIGPPSHFQPTDFTESTDANYSHELKSYECHKGIKQASITEINGVVVLPSLDANEKLFELTVLDSKGRPVDPKDYKLVQSDSTQFHGVKLPPGDYTIHFHVAIPPIKPALPEKIQLQLQKFKDYQQSEETAETNFASFRAFVDYQKTQNPPKGGCRHRAVCAYAELIETHGKDNVRIVRVDGVHMYIEIKIANAWCSVDLGGYPANVKAEHMEKAKSLPMSFTRETLEPISIPPMTFEMKEANLNTVLEKTFKTPICVVADTDVALQNFYKELHARYPSDHVYIAHDPDDIHFSSPGMTSSGKIKKTYTTLSQWFTKLGNKNGVICVDARQFDAKELAQLNDLLDGRIEDMPLPKNMRVIIIDSPQRGYYGPDFRRRVLNKITCASAKEEALLSQKPAALKNVMEIDLFESPYWQNILLGKWNIEAEEKSSNRFSFHWQKSALLELFTAGVKHREEKSRFPLFTTTYAGKSIVFRNPPLQDPRFCAFIAELQSLKNISWADQVTPIPPDTLFFQSSGYDWEAFKSIASLSQLTGREEKPPLILSDANLINFISDPIYQFSKESHQLIATNGHLTNHRNKSIDIVCAFGLSKSALAQFLDDAKKKNVKVRFLTPNLTAFPAASPLAEIFKTLPESEQKEVKLPKLPADIFLSDDIDFSVRHFLAKQKKITGFDLSALDKSELIRRPIIDEDIKKQLLETGRLSMRSQLSSIAEKLKKGETVLLYGTIPPELNEAITELSLGCIEGERYTGKLIVVAPSDNTELVRAISGIVIKPQETGLLDKIKLLEDVHPDAGRYLPDLYKSNPTTTFAELERKYYQSRIAGNRVPLKQSEEKRPSDEALSKRFDQRRLSDTQFALSISPWVMIEGATGIGKTHFLQNILKTAEKTTSSLEAWLEGKSENGKNIILVIDEASFMSQLSGEDENFLERFKSLRNTPPGFLYKGKYHELTPEHKVVFAFNPESYGAGRSTAGFLNENSVPVSFERLPYFYIHARLIHPILEETIPKSAVENSNWIADPISDVFKWINNPLKRCDGLFTGREIKMIMNIIASQIRLHGFKGENIIHLANDAAYLIGKQVLSDHPDVLKLFEKDFEKRRTNVLNAKPVKGCREEQKEDYACIQHIFDARQFIKDRFAETKQTSPTDLGLGGVVLEGDAGIGKTHFVEQLIKELEAKGGVVIRISPSTPYFEKEKKLREARKLGAIVVGEELNASLWPNKMLNNFLMGLEEDGSVSKEKDMKPGFMLIATQNPSYFAGRSEEDPALRRRMVKLNVNWPVYQSPVLEKKEEKESDNRINAAILAKLKNAISLLNHPKTSLSKPLSADEKEIVHRLTKLHDEKKLNYNDVITAYLDLYKQTRRRHRAKTELSALAKPIADCLFQATSAITQNPVLSKGIKNTPVNQLLNWIGHRDFSQFGEPIVKEIIEKLTIVIQDSSEHKTMSGYWKSYQRGIDDKENIVNLLKLLHRLGRKGYDLTNQLFSKNKSDSKKISEKDITHFLEDKTQLAILQKNIQTHFTSPKEKPQVFPGRSI